MIAEYGVDLELSPQMSGALGFTVDGAPWRDREVGARADESDSSTPLHAIAIEGGSGNDLLVSVWVDGITHFIRTNRNGQVVKAVARDPATDKSTAIQNATAQKEANAEFEFWGQNAEKAGYWWTCEAEVLGANPVNPRNKIEACTWLIQSGKETPSAVALAYMHRADAYGREDAQKKLEDRSQAVKVDPKNAMAWAQLCSAQNWISEDIKLATQSCSKAIELNPHSPEAWTFRGDIYLKTKDYDLAIADYDHAIKLFPDWMWPLDNRGEAYLRKNQIDRAIQDFNDVIRVSSDYAMGYLDRGIAKMRKNDMDAALADFQTGIKVDPTCGSCFLGLGLVKRAKGDLTGGDADIAKAKALNPKVADDFVEDGIPVP